MPYKESITNEELMSLEVGAYEGEIVVVDTPAKLKDACDKLRGSRVVGFDTETRPSFKKGKTNKMALLQLSGKDATFLIRMNKITGSEELAGIFEDKDIIKVGASIRDDIRGLRKWMDFSPEGFMDIQSMVSGYGIGELSVRKVSAIVLGIRISKAQRLSNWEAETLTHAQQLYAATDSWACREIYLRLKGYGK